MSERVGDCCWCSTPVFESDDWVVGNGGEGVMHKVCPTGKRCCDCGASIGEHVRRCTVCVMLRIMYWSYKLKQEGLL
jgi:hypothetical protein